MPPAYAIQRNLLKIGLIALPLLAYGQFSYYEGFTSVVAPGWDFQQGDTAPGPRLTAGTAPVTSVDPEADAGAVEIDTDGQGWLRLASVTGNQSNVVSLDTEIPSADNEITITFDFTMWSEGGSPADGLSVFVWDASVPFAAGGNGGSLAYATKSAQPGLAGGYFGVGFDVYGNYSNASEGREGALDRYAGASLPDGLSKNEVIVRGPESDADPLDANNWGNYAVLGGTGLDNFTDAALPAIPSLDDTGTLPVGNRNLDFPDQDFRPDQDADQYRAAQIHLDANNLLTVRLQMGAANSFVDLYTIDLGVTDTLGNPLFARPELLRIGFGASTGGAQQVYEIRNLLVETANAGSSASSIFWDNEDGDQNWATGDNWNQDTVPNDHSRVIFTDQFADTQVDHTVNIDGGDKTVHSITFNGSTGYTLDPVASQKIIFDTNSSSSSYINILNSPNGNADQTINTNLQLNNDLQVQNLVYQDLTLGGDINMQSHDLSFETYGTTTAQGVISGTGDLTASGSTGTTILQGNNTYSGDTTVQAGTLQIEHVNALGATSADTVVEAGGTLAIAGGITAAEEAVSLAGTGSDNQGALYNASGTNTWTGQIDLTDDASIGAAAGSSLTLSDDNTLDGAGHDLTFTPGAGANILVDRVITDSSGTTNVIFAGEGTTEIGFGMTNTYSGTTTLRSGTLLTNSSVGSYGEEAFGSSSSAIQMGDAQTQSTDDIRLIFNTDNGGSPWDHGLDRALDVNDYGAETILGTVGISYLDVENNINLAKDLTIDAATGTEIFINSANGGVITGTGDLKKTGTGTLHLDGTHTYTGDFHIAQGELEINPNGGNALYDLGEVSLGNEGTAVLDVQSNETIGSLSGGGSSGGQVLVSNSGVTLTTGNDDTNTTFSGELVGDGTILKTGTGIWTLAGDSDFDGTIQINSGTVQAGKDFPLFSGTWDPSSFVAASFNPPTSAQLSGGTLDLNGYNMALQTINMTTSSTIDFGGLAGSTLIMDDSPSAFSGTLTVTDWSGNLDGDGTSQFLLDFALGSTGDPVPSVFFADWGVTAEILERNDINPGMVELVPTLDNFNIWNGSSNDRWSTIGNWQDANGNPSASFPNSEGAQALFSSDYANLAGDTISLRGHRKLGILVIDYDDSHSFTFDSNSSAHILTFDSPGAASDANLSISGQSTPTFDVNISLVNDLRLANNGSGITYFGSSSSTTETFDLNSQELKVSGTGITIFNQIVEGSGGEITLNDGTLRLVRANTFTGGVTLNDGDLQIANNTALGTGALTLNDGSMGGYGADRTVSNTFTLSDTVNVANYDGSNLTLSGTGTIANGSHELGVESGVSLSMSGMVTGSGTIDKTGAGDLILSTANKTFDGLTITQGGVITAPATGNIQVGGGSSGNNYLGDGFLTLNGPTADLDVSTGNGFIQFMSSNTVTVNQGNATITTAGAGTDDDLILDATFTQTGGTIVYNIDDDVFFDNDADYIQTGGTSTFNITNGDFTTGGSAANQAYINLSGNASWTANLGTTSDFTLNQYDVFNITGNSVTAQINGGSTTAQISLLGSVNLTNGAVLEVTQGQTILDDTTSLNGGTSASKGTLLLGGDLLIDQPELTNAPNITFDTDTTSEIAALSGTQSLEGVGVLTKTGTGTTTIDSSINNILANEVVITGGTLLLADDNQIANEANMSLAGGTFATGGNSEVMNSLTLTATSTLDLGAGTSIVQYTDGGTHTAGTFNIDNWSGDSTGGGTDQVIFGQTLDSAFLANVYWVDQGITGAIQLPSGEIVPAPIPEPGFYVGSGCLMACLIGHAWRQRQRRATIEDNGGNSQT